MMQLGDRLDRWIHGFLPVTAEGLALSRIFFAGYFLVTGIPTFSWVSRNPPGFFDPPQLSIANLFATFPPMGVMRTLDLVICVLLIFLLVGIETRASSILLTVAWILGNSFRFSFGKIDHSILAVVTPAVMAFSGWGDTYSIDAKFRKAAPRLNAWPLTLLALLVAFGFFSGGLPKLLSWVDFDLTTHGVRNWLVSGWYELDRRKLLAPFAMSVHNPYVWEAFDLLAVVFEVGFLFSLARRGLFRTYLFIAIMFHLVNVLMLNIGFLTLLPVYVVFAPWERIVPRLPHGLLRAVDRLASPRGLMALLVLFLPLYLLADGVSVDTAANAFSHLGIAFETVGSFDYNWFLSVTLHPLAALIALILAGLSLPLPGRVDPIPGTGGKRVVFFDGACNLCNGFVDFLIQRDRERGLMFASLQSQPGQVISRAVPAAVPDDYYSVFLLDGDGQIYERSDAILKTLESLGGKYRLFWVLWLVPRPVRDVVYRGVSRWRYRMFGTRQSCRLPTAQERATFVPDFDTYSERAIFRA
jgi:predicted DCC family thiol-disulfide oxidoreductase YuxK